MRLSEKGFLSISVLIAVLTTTVVVSIGSYGVYKYHEIKDEKEDLEVRLSEVVEKESVEIVSNLNQVTASSSEEEIEKNATDETNQLLDNLSSETITEAKNLTITTPITPPPPNEPEATVPAASSEADISSPTVEESQAKTEEELVEDEMEETELSGISLYGVNTAQDSFNDKRSQYSQYGYGKYAIAMGVAAEGGDAFIPMTTTDSGGPMIGFEYEITGSGDVGNVYNILSKVSCSLKNDGKCKIRDGESREITVLVSLYPEDRGIYGIKFTKINYYQNGELKSVEVNSATSNINIEGSWFVSPI
ncbi:hypothetical protein COV88_04020 [Candidatus Saccharibacteria bacterium CG11_big_fil_rev_8_21_14_0_20_41_19]|nr:MAG: hypothetical protein COV88_04020 [Candidatus Saccharibacteria bacterium CG11_big_fil_rev_8_21_14_0_20_41_19]